jgi:hypothetical protein
MTFASFLFTLNLTWADKVLDDCAPYKLEHRPYLLLQLVIAPSTTSCPTHINQKCIRGNYNQKTFGELSAGEAI